MVLLHSTSLFLFLWILLLQLVALLLQLVSLLLLLASALMQKSDSVILLDKPVPLNIDINIHIIFSWMVLLHSTSL